MKRASEVNSFVCIIQTATGPRHHRIGSGLIQNPPRQALVCASVGDGRVSGLDQGQEHIRFCRPFRRRQTPSMVCIIAAEWFRIRRVRTEPIMYVGNGQPRFREGKGLFF
jgi:hypothetical protein